VTSVITVNNPSNRANEETINIYYSKNQTLFTKEEREIEEYNRDILIEMEDYLLHIFACVRISYANPSLREGRQSRPKVEQSIASPLIQPIITPVVPLIIPTFPKTTTSTTTTTTTYTSIPASIPVLAPAPVPIIPVPRSTRGPKGKTDPNKPHYSVGSILVYSWEWDISQMGKDIVAGTEVTDGQLCWPPLCDGIINFIFIKVVKVTRTGQPRVTRVNAQENILENGSRVIQTDGSQMQGMITSIPMRYYRSNNSYTMCCDFGKPITNVRIQTYNGPLVLVPGNNRLKYHGVATKIK